LTTAHSGASVQAPALASLAEASRGPAPYPAVPPSGVAAAASRAAKRWVVAAAILGTGATYVDGTAVNIALPRIQSAFAAEFSTVAWVVGAYSLFVTALLVLGGALGDRYGRRRVYSVGLGIFVAASLVCGLAPNVEVLIAARALQGLGGALLVPGSLALINATHGEHDQGKATAVWQGVSAAMGAVGPVIGAWLTEHFSWRLIFFANFPLAAALVFALVRVPETRSAEPKRLDYVGSLLLVVTFGALSFALIQLPLEPEMSRRTVYVWGLSLASGSAFFLVEARVKQPLLPLWLLRSRTFVLSSTLSFVLYAALCGVMFVIPFVLLQAHGYSVTETGASFLPFIVVVFALSGFVGERLEAWGIRRFLLFGTVLSAAGYALFARPVPGDGYWAGYFVATAVLGLGMALSMSPLAVAITRVAGKEHAGLLSGLNNTVIQAAALMAVAAYGLLMVGSFRSTLAKALESSSLNASLRSALLEQSGLLGEAALHVDAPSGLHGAMRSATSAALGEAFQQVMLLTAMAVLGSTLLVLAMPRATQTRSTEGTRS